MHAVSRPMMRMAQVALLVTGIDLATKALATALWATDPRPLFSWLSFTVVHNMAGPFGWTAGAYTWQMNLALTLCAVAFALPVTRDLAEVDHRAPRALGLIVGGALGNLVSLVLPPAGVADFIAVHWGPGHSTILNVADIAAYAGLALIARTGMRIVLAIREQARAASRVALGSAYTHKAAAKREIRGNRPRLVDAVVHDWNSVVDLGVVRADAPVPEEALLPRGFPRPMGAAREARMVLLADRPSPDDEVQAGGPTPP